MRGVEESLGFRRVLQSGFEALRMAEPNLPLSLTRFDRDPTRIDRCGSDFLSAEATRPPANNRLAHDFFGASGR